MTGLFVNGFPQRPGIRIWIRYFWNPKSKTISGHFQAQLKNFTQKNIPGPLYGHLVGGGSSKSESKIALLHSSDFLIQAKPGVVGWEII